MAEKKEIDESLIKADLYIPRKCSATNRVIISKDHASVQINIAHLDQNGIFNSNFHTVAFSGFVRASAASDDALNRIAAKEGLMKDIQRFPGADKFKTVKAQDDE